MQHRQIYSAVRAKCHECRRGSSHDVYHCTETECPLWSFRLGKRPDHPKTIEANWAAIGSDGQNARAAFSDQAKEVTHGG